MSLNPDLLEHLHTQGLWSISSTKTFGVWGIWTCLDPNLLGHLPPEPWDLFASKTFGVSLHQGSLEHPST